MECFKLLAEQAATWRLERLNIFRRSNTQSSGIPESIFVANCHPSVSQVSSEVDEYFLQHWNFPDTRSQKRFVKAGFSRVTCLYFPLSRNERIGYACRLLTLLFLIDGENENVSSTSPNCELTSFQTCLRGCRLQRVLHTTRT